MILCKIAEGIEAKKLPAVLIFADFKTAFDLVDKKKMMQVLSVYGFPDRIMKAIGVMY